MKKILVFLLVAVMALPAVAQKDVTTFLGIPVDGQKEDMKERLIGRGFLPKKTILGKEYMKGMFNDREVELYILTGQQNKVYRIMLTDAEKSNEADIKIRFNNLVSQFEENPRYMFTENQRIGEKVDIEYDISIEKKRFDAVFYQRATGADGQLDMNATLKKVVWFTITKSHGKYLINMYYDNLYNQSDGNDL